MVGGTVPSPLPVGCDTRVNTPSTMKRDSYVPNPPSARIVCIIYSIVTETIMDQCIGTHNGKDKIPVLADCSSVSTLTINRIYVWHYSLYQSRWAK